METNPIEAKIKNTRVELVRYELKKNPEIGKRIPIKAINPKLKYTGNVSLLSFKYLNFRIK